MARYRAGSTIAPTVLGGRAGRQRFYSAVELSGNDSRMELQDFFAGTEARPLSLVLVNYDAPAPLRNMFEQLFEDQQVEVTAEEFVEAERNMVYLVDDDEVVATSPLSTIRDTILLTNSDQYVTGSGGISGVELPDVIDELTETTFTLRGYPESNSEKLLLIIISRYIERLALEHEGGRHRRPSSDSRE